jgi:ABC-2 type transport system permease protein
MITETLPAASVHSEPRTAPSSGSRVRAALAAEWIKLRSLRSMPVTAVLAAFFCIGLGNLVCSNYVTNWPTFDAAQRSAFDPLDTNFNFLVVGDLFFGVLGALVLTNEYRNGLIRTTLTATPQRGLILAAKTVMVTVLTLVTSTVICLTAFFTGQSVLSGHVPHVTLGDPGVLGRVLGAIFYLTAVGLIGLFIGAIVRSTAVAMSCVFGLMLVLPVMVHSLPRTAIWRHTVPYLPSNLGNALWHSRGNTLTSPTVAVIGLSVYVLVLGVLATFALRRRDA